MRLTFMGDLPGDLGGSWAPDVSNQISFGFSPQGEIRSKKNKGGAKVEVGERIRILRERRGISQTYLASKLGIPNQSLSNYERGYRIPPSDVLKKIADFFQISVDYLLGRESFIYRINSPRDLKKLLEKGQFHYDGIILSDEDMNKIRQMIQFVIDYKKQIKRTREENINHFRTCTWYWMNKSMNYLNILFIFPKLTELSRAKNSPVKTVGVKVPPADTRPDRIPFPK